MDEWLDEEDVYAIHNYVQLCNILELLMYLTAACKFWGYRVFGVEASAPPTPLDKIEHLLMIQLAKLP